MAATARSGWQRWGARGLVPILALVLVGVAVSTAQAAYTGGVQDTGLLQLDGNSLAPNGCTLPTDWSALYQDTTTPPCGAEGFRFVNDKIGKEGDNTYWSQGGSKDAYDPALGPWLVGSNDVSPDKNDIVNAFAAIYHGTGTPAPSTEKFLYFGADRYNTNGDAQMGFQFLQSRTCIATVNCATATPNQTSNTGKFVDPDTGVPIHHKNGDILILVNFNKGGTLGLAGVFQWTGADGNGAGNYMSVLSSGTGASNPPADCLTVGDPNKFCATSSTSNLTGDPVWPYTAKGTSGQATYSASSFIEGGLDLSALPGAGSCFPSFIAETRSSAGASSGLSLSAQLKDLAFGQFENCGSTTTTTPSSTAGPTLTPIPATGISVGTGNTGVDVYDQAVVAVSGTNSYGGSVSFHLCGPTPLSDADYTTCGSGGAAIGGAKNVSDPSPSTVFSDAAHLTQAGRYCWRADYSGDAVTGVPASHDSSAGECFKVIPVQPTLSTQAVDADGNNISASVPFGNAVYDTAALSGTSYEPGTGGLGNGSIGDGTHSVTRTTKAQGSITFKLYGPDTSGSTTNCNTLATDFPTTGITVSVNGDGTYGGPDSTPAVSFTPSAPGVYHWKATYTGDAPNTLDATHNGDCSDANEDVTVQQLQPEITTAQNFVPNDSATITVGSGTGDLAGTATFYLFVNDSTCGGGDLTKADYTSDAIDVSTGTGTGTSRTVTSDNSTAYGTDGTTFHWVVVFDSTNPAQKDATSGCGNEHSSIAIDNGTQQP